MDATLLIQLLCNPLTCNQSYGGGGTKWGRTVIGPCPPWPPLRTATGSTSGSHLEGRGARTLPEHLFSAMGRRIGKHEGLEIKDVSGEWTPLIC